MDITSIPIGELYIDLNARRSVTQGKDEASVKDLAKDIQHNGLLNPLTVRKTARGYEIIAGQRRYLAMKELAAKSVPCHIIEATDTKVEELSLAENLQRNAMTYSDKAKACAHLYEVYDQDITKLMQVLHLSKPTIVSYLHIAGLPPALLKYLDKDGKDRLTLKVAEKFCMLHADQPTLDLVSIYKEISAFNTQEQLRRVIALREGKRNASSTVCTSASSSSAATKESQGSYIYIFNVHPYDENYKVGFTERHPNSRKDDLKTITLHPIRTEVYFSCRDGHRYEKMLHLIFKEHRVKKNREFFKIPLGQLVAHCLEVKAFIDTQLFKLNGPQADEKVEYFFSANAIFQFFIWANPTLKKRELKSASRLFVLYISWAQANLKCAELLTEPAFRAEHEVMKAKMPK
jgi:ParB/RepB/Spo0J family partition protein